MFNRSLTFGFFFLPLLLLIQSPSSAWSQDGLPREDADIITSSLGLETEEERMTVTARTPRPTSKIAENVTVISAEEITRLNVHSLSELLQTIPGIQFDKAGRTPGMYEFLTIQGANSQHILVLMDGVSQNEQGQNMADLGAFPVQQIERVEIIKGGASATWGQALGGVVNIITKVPNPDKLFSGAASSSMGERFTTDQRLEFSGTVDRLGYYLTGGILHSDGLLANNGINQNNIFGKLAYELPTKGRLTLSIGNSNSRRGIEEIPPKLDISGQEVDNWHDNYDRKQLYSIISFVYPLAQRLNLELDGHYSYLKTETRQRKVTSSNLSKQYVLNETDSGTKGKLIWGNARFNLTTGLEYEHDQIAQRDTVTTQPAAQIDKNFNRYGIFANGTLSYGELTILPGIRYDRVDADHNEVSYTLGATYRLTEKSVLRSYFARGYSRTLAVLNNYPPQKGWTAQVGAETGDIPYLWLKGTLFYNDTWNMVDTSGTFTTSAQIRQGVEIEARTIPLYDFSISAGYTLTDLRDKKTRIRAEGIPGDLLKLAITYQNSSWGLQSILSGNYVWWNAADPAYPAKDRNFLWNFRITQKLLPADELSPELFLTVNNLFNNAQYAMYQYPNAGRWLEGGMRFSF